MSEMEKKEPRENYLVPTENVDKRTEFNKTYTVGPGKYQAFTSAIPLHRKNKETGKWEELDATFKAEKENDVLASAGAKMTVSCGVSGEQAFIALKDQEDHRLAWGYEEAEAVKPEAIKEEIKEEDHVLQAFFEAMSNAQGSVRYSGIFPGVDMVCRNDSRFKDEFIFSAPEFARKIVCRLESNGLRFVSEDDGSMVVFDTDGKKIYNILAPTLMDSEGQEGIVQVSLEEAEEGYRLIYDPDPSFMETAAYPVTMDPSVRTNSQDYAIEDTYVRSSSPAANYYGSQMILANRIISSGNQLIDYGLLKITGLPQLGADHYITGASLVMHKSSGNAVNQYLYLREAMNSWDASTVTWNTKPQESDIIQDYAIAGGAISFGITGPVRKWYQNPGSHLGVLITPWEGSCFCVLFGSSAAGARKPYLQVEYVSLAGLEDYLTYDTVSAGKAGAGHVALANGNLAFVHGDTAMNGARMSVSVSHVYNSCRADRNDFFCGYGWRTNFHQTLHQELLDETTYYVYTDGDGTEHWFSKETDTATKYKDESGLSMELVPGSESVTIRDKGDNVMTFPLISTAPTADDPVTEKVLVSKIADACGNTITVYATGMKITGLTDGAGRSTTFVYAGDLLTKIKTPWHTDASCISFTYSNGCLTGIAYEDGNGSAYTYRPEAGPNNSTYRLLAAASGPEGVTAEFTYANANQAGGLPHAVVETEVTGGTGEEQLTASHMTYTYGPNLCLVTDELTGKTLRYHFNDSGNATSVDDGLGYAVFADYDRSGENADAPVNHPTGISRIQCAVNNLLADGLLSKTVGTPWTKGGTGTVARNVRSGGFGAYQQQFTVAVGNTLYIRQSAAVTAGKTYTLSGYAQSLGAKAYLRVTAGNMTFQSMPVELCGDTETETELRRTQVTFTVPGGVSSISCDLAAEGTARGTIAWWDSVQLEEGETANHVNLLENSDLHDMTGTLPAPWQRSSNTSIAIDRLSCQEEMPAHLSGNAIMMPGKCNELRRVWQTVRASGTQGDRYTVGGWCSAYARKQEGTDIVCRLQVYFSSTGSDDWSEWKLGGSASFNHEEGTWQFACGDVKAPNTHYNWIRVVMVYGKQVNSADFTNLYLYREHFGTTYKYDARGNWLKIFRTTGMFTDQEYDDYNNLTRYIAPGHTLNTEYQWGSTEEEKRKHLLKKEISPLGTVSTYQYDANGNPTESKAAESENAAAKFIKTTTTYTAAGTYAAAQTDARGKTVSYVTDPDKGVVTSVTDPKNQTVNSEYDTLRRLTKTSTKLTDTKEVRTENAYDSQKGCLAALRHNTAVIDPNDDTSGGFVTYTFGYDSLGRQTAVTVGTGANVHVLSTTAYDVLVRRVSDVVFGNPGSPVGSVHYTYDSFGRLTAVRYDNETADRFTYRYDATGRVGVLEDHERQTLTYTDYDLAGRPAMKTKLLNGAHVYTGRLTYNAYELPDVFTEQVGTAREKHTTAFGYDEENRVTSLQYDGSTDEQVAYTYDALGRIITRTVTVNGQAHTTTYTYVPGSETNGTTGLIQTITQNGVTLTYTYDDNGNITSVSDGTKTVSYAYDAIGQLIRVNDPYDTRSGSDGTTWTFEYDLGGNILRRKRYAYTAPGTAVPASHLQQIQYAYGDSSWKDKLTSYNGVSITSDSIGNITAYGAWTYQWRHGRELVHMSRSQYQPIEVDFEYNEDGLRTKKTITDENDVVTVTEYTLHGKNIVHMKKGVHNLHFFYDGQGKPSIVAWNNGTTTNKYAYVYNLQGDVIALVNSAGTKVVNYTYDAWGKPITKSGSLAGTLGTLNPFRYRGYVYDEEIDFYYLRSRYYNANRGRFINADSVFDGTNLFRYCYNNPENTTDNDGTDAELGYHYETLQYSAQIVAGGAMLYELDSNYPKCNDYYNRGYVDGGTVVYVTENVFVKNDHPEDIYIVHPDDMLIVEIDLGNGKKISGRMYRKNIDVSYSSMTAMEAFGDITINNKNFGKKQSPDRRIWNFQQYINRKISKKIDVDGYWGPNTRDAIVSFQRKYGLTVDGEAGTKTKNRLIQEVAIN